jgi:predicted amidohydrolase YtcJ
MEDKIGSLEINKKADFVILEANPFEVPKENIHLINVIGTYVNGQKVL